MNRMTYWSKFSHLTVTRTVLRLNKTQPLHYTKLSVLNFHIRRQLYVPAFRKLFTLYAKTSTQLIQVNFMHDDPGSDSDSEIEEISDDLMDLYNYPEAFSVRHLLYPDTECPLIKQLNESTSVQDVFNFIREHELDLDAQLVSQSVLVLWDLQKIFYKVNAMNSHPSPLITELLNPYDVLKQYIQKVSGHEDFGLILKLVDKHCEDFSADALTAVLLYLSKMGVGLNRPVMQKLIAHCEMMLEKYGSRIPLTALSRFTVAIHSKRGLWPILISKQALPHLLTELDNCNSADNFRLLTISLNNIKLLVTGEILNAYKNKAETLVDEGIITAEDARLIAKIIRFLNYPHWSHNNCSTIRKLMLILKGNVFQSQLEPADIMDEMHEAATKFLSQTESATIGSSPLAMQGTTDLFACLVTFSSPEQKSVLEKLTQTHVQECAPSTLPTLFKVLRHLKTSNVELCDMYMHFNNNLGGTYRHYELEMHMINWLWNEVENGIAGVIPSKFARVASFMLAYGNIGQNRSVITDDILMHLVNKMLNMTYQFNKMDCLYISRGLKTGLAFGQRRNMSQRFLEVFIKIDTMMNNCTLQHLQYRDLKLSDINKLMKAYISRRRLQETALFDHLIQRYQHYNGELSSRSLRDLTTNLLVTNCLVPSSLDCLVDYVIQNRSHILGDTVIKLLYTCYTLGYQPTQANEFFPAAADIIYRDRERIQGLALLQAAIALCFFHQMPENLIHFIFTVHFLERLDEEVHNCYAKATYPMRVRDALMHVNRAVCLDYPEVDVPWFHEKYCQQITSLEPQRIDAFHKNVLQNLVAVIGGEHLVYRKMYTPYFYRLDFQVFLDKENKPVSIRKQADSNITKIAVLLWDADVYTTNVSQLCGEQQLKQRHLEMLGYKVIGISSSLWNSMYMSESEAKTNYLRKEIWPSDVQKQYMKT
ncbi:hypothetical protein C0J52_05617 [Blattella germanica]|nr:hypothetical protein C0J52_05617 [Blattella germanica]